MTSKIDFDAIKNESISKLQHYAFRHKGKHDYLNQETHDDFMPHDWVIYAMNDKGLECAELKRENEELKSIIEAIDTQACDYEFSRVDIEALHAIRNIASIIFQRFYPVKDGKF